jgi:putative flippase GtrA
MRRQTVEAIEYFIKQSPVTIWQRLRARDMPWLVQLMIYGMCGVMATVVSVGQVVLLSKTLIPAYEGMVIDPQSGILDAISSFLPGHAGLVEEAVKQGGVLSDTLRAKHLLVNNTIAFLTTNVFVYWMNVMLVFKRGRHHPWVEFLWFTVINGVSFGLSQIAGPWLVHRFGVTTNLAIFTNTLFAVVINFVARKFFVFKG